MAEGKITRDKEVSSTELAAVLGVTVRRVQQMAQDGTIPPVRRGRFLLCDSVQRYLNFLLRDKEQSQSGLEKETAETEIKKAKAVIAKLEAEELQGKMHRSEDVAAMTEDLIYAIRGMLVALPGRLAVDVSAAGSPAEAAEVIRREVFKVMQELTGYRYDPHRYAERVRERKDWDERNGDDE